MSGFDDIPTPVQEMLDTLNLCKSTESRWVKSMSTRMRVFNTQIFENILKGHCKDNAEMNYAYMHKTFNKLFVKVYMDDDISNIEYIKFCHTFDKNLNKLHAKEIKDDQDDDISNILSFVIHSIKISINFIQKKLKMIEMTEYYLVDNRMIKKPNKEQARLSDYEIIGDLHGIKKEIKNVLR